MRVRHRAADYSLRRYGPNISNHSAMADAWKYLIVSRYLEWKDRPNEMTWVM